VDSCRRRKAIFVGACGNIIHFQGHCGTRGDSSTRMRAAVVCALAGLVPAQAFMPGAVLPVRSAALASSHALASPLRSHAPSLALNKR